MSKTHSSLTVAICTYNRRMFLEVCLSSIIDAATKQSHINVLVIDNNSTDTTRCYLDELSKRYSFIHYLFCAEQGLSYARNMAVAHCKTDWISFVDDDAYIDVDWLSTNISFIEKDKYDAFGGAYKPWFKDGKKRWFLEEFESNLRWMPNKDDIRLKAGDPYFSGGNCTYRRKSLLQVGKFDEALGMKGETQNYGEEVQLQRALAMQGYILGFTQNMVIYHFTPLSKQSVWWAFKRAFINGKLFWQIYEKERSYQNILFYTRLRAKNLVHEVINSANQDIFSTSPSITRFCYKNTHLFGILGLWFGAMRSQTF